MTAWQQLLGWSAAALVLLMPVHLVFVRAGFAIKPWFIPLGAGVIALAFVAGDALNAAKQAGWWIVGGLGALLSSAVIGLIAAGERSVAARHAGGVFLVVLVAAIIASARSIPYLGVAVRLGAVVMSGAALGQAVLLYSDTVSVAALTWNSRFAEQAAEVTTAGVLVVNGTQVDANFSALYAVTWIFLVVAYPALSWFNRTGDGVVVGLLLGQLVVSGSKGGVLALLAGGAIAGIGVWLRRRGPRRGNRTWKRPVAATAITFGVVLAGLLVADAVDGESDLIENYDVRYGQVFQELDRFGGLVAIVLPDASEGELKTFEGGQADRSQIWLTYSRTFRNNPATGTGYGVASVDYSYAHNAPLEAAAGGGVLGLAGWVALLIGLVGVTVRNLRSDAAALPLAAALTAVMVGSMVLTTNYEPILGLVIGLTVLPHLAPNQRVIPQTARA